MTKIYVKTNEYEAFNIKYYEKLLLFNIYMTFEPF